MTVNDLLDVGYRERLQEMQDDIDRQILKAFQSPTKERLPEKPGTEEPILLTDEVTEGARHARMRDRIVRHLWDNDLLEEYHERLISTGIMIEEEKHGR